LTLGRPGGLFVAIFLPEERGQKGFSLQSLTQNPALSKNIQIIAEGIHKP